MLTNSSTLQTSIPNLLSQSLTIPTSFKSSIKEDFDPRILETDPSSNSPTCKSQPRFKLNISPNPTISTCRTQKKPNPHPSTDFHNILSAQTHPKTSRDYYTDPSLQKKLTFPNEDLTNITHVHTLPNFDSPIKETINYSSLRINPVLTQNFAEKPPLFTSNNNDLYDILSVKPPLSARNNGRSPFDATQSFHPGASYQAPETNRATVRPAAASQAYMNAMKALQEKTKGLEEKMVELQTENLLLKGYGREGRKRESPGRLLREVEEENRDIRKEKRELEKRNEELEGKNGKLKEGKERLKKKVAGLIEEKEKEKKVMGEEIEKVKKENEEMKVKNKGLEEKVKQLEKEIIGNKKGYNQHIQYLTIENEALKADVGQVKDYYSQELSHFENEFNVIQEDNVSKLKEYEEVLAETDKYTSELKELLALKNKEIEALRLKVKELTRETPNVEDMSGALDFSCSIVGHRRSALYDVQHQDIGLGLGDHNQNNSLIRNGTPHGRMRETPSDLNKNNAHKNVRKFFLELNKAQEQDLLRKSEASIRIEDNGTPASMKQAGLVSSKGVSLAGRGESSAEQKKEKTFDINSLFPGYNAAMASCLNSSRFLRNDETEVVHEEGIIENNTGILEDEIIYGNLKKDFEEKRIEDKEEPRRTQADANKKTRNVHGNFSFGGTPKGVQPQIGFEAKKSVNAGQPNQSGRSRQEYKDLRLEDLVSEDKAEEYQIIEDEVNELI